MGDTAKLILEGKEYELPVVVGSEGERGIDITKLRGTTGHITLDTGYMNTGATKSDITFINGEQGILRYRGIPIDQLAEKSTFVEVAYLLIYGKLPTQEQLDDFNHQLTYHSLLHESMTHLFDGFPTNAHPMAVLSSMACALSAYYPECLTPTEENTELNVTRLMAKLTTIAAFSFKKSIGQALMYPQNRLSYCANFLHMMFAVKTEEYEINPEMVKALDLLLILHADHEQNCSTSTVRLVGSSDANLFASVSAAINALWGPLHGGANQKVIEMLQQIQNSGGDPKDFMEKVKSKADGIRLMGFGHRVYKNFDPRATILKKTADKVLKGMGISDPLLDIAMNLEDIALKDDYFVERKLYPNVDFYSGLIYKAMGIPTDMFTVLFAIGRLPGWIAQWKEMLADPGKKIGRPRQIYTGENQRDFVPIDKR